ncbi:MAG: hypothetical protein LC800_01930 [Acidobacteria bacterium]|nr:hypothetical protein [Acidobacteriota bacterium]
MSRNTELLRRTRELGVWLALSTHGLVLGLLVVRGHNSVVWAWNAALMLSVVVSFRRSDTFVRQSFARRAAGDAYGRAAQVIAVCCAVLPLASWWGWWDVYLSGALYSGNTAVAVVRVGEGVYERLPETARRQAFTANGGERMLPVFEWSMAELNVPPYPEPRVYRQIAREVCGFAGDGGGVELIMKGSPARRDGSYQVTRTNCSQLDR